MIAMQGLTFKHKFIDGITLKIIVIYTDNYHFFQAYSE
jgi:hypothetical protein